MYPGCSTTPKEKRAVLLHYVKNHLQPHEAPYLCKLCNAGIADEKNVQEHLTSKRHIKKQHQNVDTHITVEATGKPRNFNTMMKPVEVEKKETEAKAKLTTDELLNQLSMRLGDSEQKGLIEKLRNSRDLLSEAIQLSEISNDEPEPEKDAPMNEDEDIENAKEMENEGDSATELEEDEMNDDSDDDDVKEYEENKKESKRMTEEEEEIQAAVK